MDIDEKFSRKEWIDFIRELKDKETKKLNFSGFSMAAYIIFVLTMSNSFINAFPEIYLQKNTLLFF